ncbi:SGNH/GDSL hydrolase family protein [Rhodohalobacter sulfatireducens]|uniref:GDSL-type esterase/lipase family protein n=1 Tax=Rhodohalobacter sulfatireducens TaxID=2911366 RepID=A0ABS9KI27_9BACT|nr:SGNH/GDSL hydrolase family protein [Rhodohalobacter sulfatireducens]MCG2590437.1 GDSL-type esterase/lipase family protein [Rhodohalobacter sulfatireducens]MDR9365056.1 GDSL-type esterase/lipase family protein [Balneolaceae bacterium]MDR9408875.1 GDSL-type esterase/lipase family protein [Balneolaceae bacterium]
MMKFKTISLFLFIVLMAVFNAYGQGLDEKYYHTHRGSLNNSCQKFQEGEARIAFLGGSITYNPGWRDSLYTYFTHTYPETDFDFINAGIPSMGSTPGAFRFERDVLKNGPVDLLFLEAAVNDFTNGRTPTEITRGIEGIVRHSLREDPATSIVIMHFVDPVKMKDYRNGNVPEVIRLHEEVARHYNISTINLAKEVTERIDAGEFDWENDFKDLHPSPFGQDIYYRSMKKFLEGACEVAQKDEKLKTTQIPGPLDPYSYANGTLIEPGDDYASGIGWELVEDWQPSDEIGTRSNYVDVPMLVGVYPGEPIRFQFEGNTAGIAVASGPNAGIIEYRIDGSPWKKQDLFTQWSQQLYLPWFFTLASGLESGKHSLEIRLLEEKNLESEGRQAIIRYFYYNAE